WHPLHVESVAWVAERKDVLCALFWVATLWAYGRYATCEKGKLEIRNSKSEGKPRVWYSLALFTFALALMSKPMAVTLPFVLLLVSSFRLLAAETNPITSHGLPISFPPHIGESPVLCPRCHCLRFDCSGADEGLCGCLECRVADFDARYSRARFIFALSLRNVS